MWWVVDRIEGHVALLVSDAGSQIQVPARGLKEGQVYGWRGRRFIRSLAEEQRRARAAKALQRRLAATDRGGDVSLSR